MTRRKTLMPSKKPFLSLALGALLGGCLSQPPDNIQPVARIRVNGMDTMVAQSDNPPLILPPMGTVTLDGSTSVDPDGIITHFMWWDTGTPAAMRFPQGSTLAAGAEKFPPDFGIAPSASVPATEGTIYSLYVVDDNNEVSQPATVKFQTMPVEVPPMVTH
jgi:hypothetical protein